MRPCPRQRLGEVVRQRRLELELLARERVPEPELGAVQELAGEAVAPGMPVARVARDRVADRGEVGADLVGAAGLQAHLDQGVRRQQLEHPEVGAGLARRAAANRPALGGPVVASQGGVDRPGSRARMALDQRQIGAPHLSRLDLPRQPAVGLVAARDEHQPGGVLVEAMDDPGPLRILAAGEQISQHVDERRAAVPRSRVDDQAGGLLDHRQPLVGVDDARLEAHARRRAPPIGRPPPAAPSERAPAPALPR